MEFNLYNFLKNKTGSKYVGEMIIRYAGMDLDKTKITYYNDGIVSKQVRHYIINRLVDTIYAIRSCYMWAQKCPYIYLDQISEQIFPHLREIKVALEIFNYEILAEALYNRQPLYLYQINSLCEPIEKETTLDRALYLHYESIIEECSKKNIQHIERHDIDNPKHFYYNGPGAL